MTTESGKTMAGRWKIGGENISGIPTISFFGAGRSIVTKPIGRKNVVIDKSKRCNPCKKNICCLNAIKKSDVNYAIESLHLDS